MKRAFLGLLCALLWTPLSWQVRGQGSDAATVALQRDMEERFRRLNADVQTISETQDVIQRRQDDLRQRLDKMETELRNLREDQGRSSGNLVTRDEFRKYAEKLKELDEKREADKKLIMENIRDLAKVAAAPAVESPKAPPRHAPESADELPYVYTVKKNDRLLDIIAAYNKEYQKQGLGKITLEQVLKANPGLKPERLVAGKKIQIPVPLKESK